MSDNIDLKKLRIGMTAHSYRFGSCKIIGIGTEDDAYPIRVQYDQDDDTSTYTIDGRIYADEARDLFFSNPKITGRAQPSDVTPGDVIVIAETSPTTDTIYKVCLVKEVDEEDVAGLNVIASNRTASIGSRVYVNLNLVKYTRVVE